MGISVDRGPGEWTFTRLTAHWRRRHLRRAGHVEPLSGRILTLPICAQTEQDWRLKLDDQAESRFAMTLLAGRPLREEGHAFGSLGPTVYAKLVKFAS